MPDLNDDNLDVLLREHFSAELDGQLGRAPAAFARSPRRSPWRAVLFTIGGGMALAAAVAAVFLLTPALSPFGGSETHDPGSGAVAINVTPAPDGSTGEAAPGAAVVPVEHEIAWNTIDQGTVFLNGEQPMRSIRRQRLDSLRWVDPATNATIEMSVPRDEVVLVGLNAN